MTTIYIFFAVHCIVFAPAFLSFIYVYFFLLNVDVKAPVCYLMAKEEFYWFQKW